MTTQPSFDSAGRIRSQDNMPLGTSGSVQTWNLSGTPVELPIGDAGKFLQVDTLGTSLQWNTAVTSITIDSPQSTIAISGSPITTTGTIDIDINVVSLAKGGLGQPNVASNGGIFYSTGLSGTILPGTATSNQIILSGSNTAPSWSSATYPSSTTINQILYSNANNTIAGIATGNNGVLITSAGGVPSINSTLPSAVQGNITRIGTIAASPYTLGALVSSSAGAITQSVGTANQVFVMNSSATGMTWTSVIPVTSGVTSLTGTANQVFVNGTVGVLTRGDITLTLPQSIATSSSPAFAGITLNTFPVVIGGNFTTGASFVTGGTFSTTGTFSTGGNFSTSSTVSIVGPFATGGSFSTGGVFSTGGIFSTTGTFSSGGNFSTASTFSTTGTFSSGGNFSTASTFSTGGAFVTTGTFSSGGNFSTASTFSAAGVVALAGDFSTVGAYSVTFNFTGATNVTFPTSGTLATTAGVVSSITGTANQIQANGSYTVAQTGAVTLALPQDINTGSRPDFGGFQVSGSTFLVQGPASLGVVFMPNAVGGQFGIGGSAQTGSINIGNSIVTQSINLGALQTNSGETLTVNVGNAGNQGGNIVVNIGSGGSVSSGTNTINALTGVKTNTLNMGNYDQTTLAIQGNLTLPTTSSQSTSTGTASQTTTVVTKTAGAAFTSSMVGGIIRWASGDSAFVTAFTDTTHLVVSPSQSVGSGAFKIYYQGTQFDKYGNLGVQNAYFASAPIIPSFTAGIVQSSATGVLSSSYTVPATSTFSVDLFVGQDFYVVRNSLFSGHLQVGNGIDCTGNINASVNINAGVDIIANGGLYGNTCFINGSAFVGTNGTQIIGANNAVWIGTGNGGNGNPARSSQITLGHGQTLHEPGTSSTTILGAVTIGQIGSNPLTDYTSTVDIYGTTTLHGAGGVSPSIYAPGILGGSVTGVDAMVGLGSGGLLYATGAPRFSTLYLGDGTAPYALAFQNIGPVWEISALLGLGPTSVNWVALGGNYSWTLGGGAASFTLGGGAFTVVGSGGIIKLEMDSGEILFLTDSADIVIDSTTGNFNIDVPLTQFQGNQVSIYNNASVGNNLGVTNKLAVGSNVTMVTSSATAGTAVQSGFAVTGTGTSFSSSMVGGLFTFSGGQFGTVTAVADGTHLTLDKSQSVGSTTYDIAFSGFTASNTGSVGLQAIYAPGNFILDASGSAVSLFANTLTQAIAIGGASSTITLNGTVNINSLGNTSITGSLTQASGNVILGQSNVAQTILIGGSVQTGDITLGSSGATNAVKIGTGAGDTAVSSLSGGGTNVFSLGNNNATNISLKGNIIAPLSVSSTSSVGSYSQSTNTITGTGFTSSMVGGIVRWESGETAFVTGFTNSTTLTATPSQTVASAAARITYQGIQGTPAGTLSIQNLYADLDDGELLIGSTGSSCVKTALTPGAGISITNGPGSITIASSDAGVTWQVVTGSTQAIVSQNAYIAANATLTTFTLPVTAAVGDTFIVTGKVVATGWKIEQNSGQTIYFGDSQTTTGTGGSLRAVGTRDDVEIVCVTADTDFQVVSSVGNVTIS